MPGDGDTSYSQGVPVPENEGISVTPQNMPDLIRQLLDRINALEQLSSGNTTSLAGLQAAQTTVQQSVNLIQAAHNNLHDQFNAGTAPSSSSNGATGPKFRG